MPKRSRSSSRSRSGSSSSYSRSSSRSGSRSPPPKAKDRKRSASPSPRRREEKPPQRERAPPKVLRDSDANGDGDDAEAAPRAPRSRTVEDPFEMAAKTAAGAEGVGGRTGGLYVPPWKLAQMMKDVQDKKSKEYQRMTWEALKKSINGLVNKVNVSNLKHIVLDLFAENIIRGRALLVRSLMKAQLASPGFTHVYAALISVVNTKMPEIGELLLKRCIHQFRRAFKRNDKILCISCTRFLAHLVNQQVAHELIALQMLTLLLETPTDDSVEVAVGFVTECGATLAEVTPAGLNAIFERLRGVLHEGLIDRRVQYMIEGCFKQRKGNFAEHPSVMKELDLVEADDQVCVAAHTSHTTLHSQPTNHTTHSHPFPFPTLLRSLTSSPSTRTATCASTSITSPLIQSTRRTRPSSRR